MEKAGWSVANLAKQCGVSVRTLERYFLESKGRKPKAWLNERRQQQAMKMLLQSYSVKETARRLGYSWASTFCREFRKHWGFPPAQATQELSALNSVVA